MIQGQLITNPEKAKELYTQLKWQVNEKYQQQVQSMKDAGFDKEVINEQQPDEIQFEEFKYSDLVQNIVPEKCFG